MFSYLCGVVKQAQDQSIVVDVRGIGFSLLVANPELFLREKEMIVFTYMHWSQEQGPTLYGFLNAQERAVFLLVISCSGIGPKIALLVLQKLTPFNFLKAIQSNDVKVLSSISGIGPKKAEQLIMQLKHKVASLFEQEWPKEEGQDAALLEQWKDISQVLQSLNYSRAEIEQALGHISQEGLGQAVPFDLLMRKALSFLAKRV